MFSELILADCGPFISAVVNLSGIKCIVLDITRKLGYVVYTDRHGGLVSIASYLGETYSLIFGPADGGCMGFRNGGMYLEI